MAGARLTTGQILLPYQLAWCEDESPSKLGEKGRQEGWTWAEGYDATSRRMRRTQPRALNYWYSATDESAGAEFIEYCGYFSRKLFARIADRFTEDVEAPETRKGFITSHCIRCSPEVRITAMSSNPRRFRGKRGDVRVDECAFHDDAGGMHDAASPVTQWGGTYGTWSTHNGEGSLFYSFVKTARKIYAALGIDPDHPMPTPYSVLEAKAIELGVSPVFSYHRVTILDAVAQGLVERINEVTGTNVSREQFLQRLRLKARNLDAYNQEYLCVASADATAWLPYSLIEACERDDIPQPVFINPDNRIIPSLKDYKGEPLYVGFDVGRIKDLSVIPIMTPVGDVLVPLAILCVEKMSIPDQVDLVARMLKGKKVVRICVDYTGVGIGVGDGLEKVFGPYVCEKIAQSNPAKEIEAVGLLTCMEDRKIRLPANNQRLRDGLHKVRKEFTASGKPRFVADSDDEGHADEFWGIALAVHAWKGAGRAGEFKGQIGRKAVMARRFVG